MKRQCLRLSLSLGLGLAAANPGWCELAQECSVLDATGGRTSGGAYAGVSAGGQSGGVMTSSNGDLTLYAGFLGCMILQADLDTDGDGLADELDSDNDNDGLKDVVELAGAAFVPGTVTAVNNADSDGDGVVDGREAAAMTNPLDPLAYLHITAIEIDPSAAGEASIEWLARSGSVYRLYSRSSLSDPLPGTLVNTVTAGGGVGPWFETTASIPDTSIGAEAMRFYQVEKQ